MDSVEIVSQVKQLLATAKLNLHNELTLQSEMLDLLSPLNPIQSFRLDDKNIIDFFIEGVGIEVKIKGSRLEIFRQCERYCRFKQIHTLVLVTNRATGFPPEILNKPCYVINLGIAWL